MKRCEKTLLPFSALFFALCIVGTSGVSAQTFRVLWTVDGTNGMWPHSLIVSGNKIYGTAERGGSTGNGSVFKVNTDGTGFEVLHNFQGGSNDGAVPFAELVLSGNTLYGTTLYGGGSGVGTVFAISTNG